MFDNLFAATATALDLLPAASTLDLFRYSTLRTVSDFDNDVALSFVDG